MLGMDVKLYACVSKANYRMQIMFTSSSKTELEVAARVLVVSSGSLFERPVVKIAQTISNPQNWLLPAFHSHGMLKTCWNPPILGTGRCQ